MAARHEKFPLVWGSVIILLIQAFRGLEEAHPHYRTSLVAQSVKKPPAMQEIACNIGDQGSVPGSGSSPGEGNGNPVQYSCLENPMDREAWQAIVHGVTKNQIQLSD